MKYLFTLLIAFAFYLPGLACEKKNPIPKEFRKSIPLLTKYIVRNSSTDQQKVDSIYYWVTHNIAYDYQALKSSKPIQYQSAQAVFKKKKAICSGYVLLMKEMLQQVGIQSEYIEGYTRPYEMDTNFVVTDANHAWIAIFVNNNWTLADPTWDAGYIGRIPKKVKTYPKRWSKEKQYKWKRYQKFKENRLQKKKSNFDKRIAQRDPFTNKFGFVAKPDTNWYKIHNDSFLVEHLPVLPQWQLKSPYITLNQFCDKYENLPANFCQPKGNAIEYEILNEEFSAKNLLDKWIYTAEEGFKFNPYNYSIKAIHYHNFVGVLTVPGFKKSMNHLPLEHAFPIYETLYNMSDTVVTYSKAAIDSEKQSFKSTQKDIASKFKLEETEVKNQQKSLEKVTKQVEKVEKNIEKNQERNKQEISFCENKIDEIIQTYSSLNHTAKLVENDQQQLRSLIYSVDSLENRIHSYHKNWYELVDTSFLINLFDHASEAEYLLRLNQQYISFNSLESTKKIRELDSLSLIEINQLIHVMADSLSAEFPQKDPFLAIKSYENLIKKYKPILKILAQEKKITNAENIEYYLYKKYIELLNDQLKFNYTCSNYFDFLELNLREFTTVTGTIEHAVSDVIDAKDKRQSEITKEVEIANKRNLTLYKLLLDNGKSWKVKFKKKLK